MVVGDHTSIQESRACEMLSGSAISDIKDRLSEMDDEYAGSATPDARRKPMPANLMWRVA